MGVSFLISASQGRAISWSWGLINILEVHTGPSVIAALLSWASHHVHFMGLMCAVNSSVLWFLHILLLAIHTGIMVPGGPVGRREKTRHVQVPGFLIMVPERIPFTSHTVVLPLKAEV